MSGIFVPIAFFAMIAAIIIVPKYLQSQERQKLQDTLRAAIEKGQPLPPEVVTAMTSDVKVRPKPSPQRDLRVGVVWMGVAVGLAAMGLAISFEDADVLYPMLGVAAFPGFIGLAFIVISFFGRGQNA